MKQKFILFLFVVMFIGTIISTNASDVREFDPTKVIIDTDSGSIVFMPRVEDYQYDLLKRQMEAEKEVVMTQVTPSLKDKIFGKKCNKR